ncbi:MAG TPA: phosphoglycerate mutase family protein [Longimicrobiales bacterium]
MQLLVIRHGRAESVKEFAKTGLDDDARPLTDDGRERMRQGAAGLRRLVDEIDVLATSPLVRARETAEIIGTAYDGLQVLDVDALRPQAAPADFAEWLRDAGSKETIAIVGHETQLQELVGWLLVGRKDPIVEIKKGGAVMLEVPMRGGHRVRAGSATLLWSLAPRQLRLLGG